MQCCKIEKANLTLVTYNGHNLYVLGCIEPVVTYGGEEKNVRFAIIGDSMSAFNLQLSSIIQICVNPNDRLKVTTSVDEI